MDDFLMSYVVLHSIIMDQEIGIAANSKEEAKHLAIEIDKRISFLLKVLSN